MRLLFLFLSIVLVSCFSIKTEKNKQSPPKILTMEHIDSLIMMGGGVFNWDFASDEMVYSLAMHGDSILSIIYTIYDDKNRKYDYSVQNLTDEWIQKRDEIIQDILEEERRFRGQPKLEAVHLLPRGFENRHPYLSVKITSPEVIRQLRDNEAVTSIATGYPAHLYK